MKSCGEGPGCCRGCSTREQPPASQGPRADACEEGLQGRGPEAQATSRGLEVGDGVTGGPTASPSLRLQGLSMPPSQAFLLVGRCMSEPQEDSPGGKGEPGARVLGGGAGTL